MNSAAARQSAALPLRPLAVLTLGVLLAHALLLEAAPPQWGPQPGADVPRPRPFITRTLEIKPAATLAAAPASPRVPVPRRPRAATSLESDRPPALATRSPTAIESIANPDSGPPAAEVVPAPPPEPTAVAAAAQTTAPPMASASTALSIPGSVRLNYAMTGRSKNMDYSAFAALDWLHDGQSYDAKLVVSALFLGSRSMGSSGRITADGLAPTRFSDKSRSERAAHFEADKGKISFSANTPDAPWLPGAQDRLSVFLQLSSLLAGDPARYPAGSTVALYTAGPRDANVWTFTVAAEETLSLPAGDIAAVKLTRKPQRDYDQTVEIWLAPGMAYLPVRNRITQHNGDFVDQQLRSAERP